MDASMATIDVTANGSSIRSDHLAWAEERLGPKPGKWSGYDDIADDETRKQLWSKVGYIHGLSAEAGRSIVSIGQTLRDMKDILPHGQFMDCVKAEFGWSQSWAHQLMAVAERFSNHNSSYDLPSSAKVLALLAASGADDATVEQAATEGWTVAETKERLRKPSSPRGPQPTEALALSIIRKGEVERLRQALQLAEQAATVTADQVMAEQRLRDLGKLRYIPGADADFHRLKDGSWVRLPHAGRVDIQPEPDQQPAAQKQPAAVATWDAAPLLKVDAAAERLGITATFLQRLLTPSVASQRNGQPLIRNGYIVTREGRGMVRLTPVEP